MAQSSSSRAPLLSIVVLSLLAAVPGFGQKFFDGVNSMGPYAWVSPGQPGTPVIGGSEGGANLAICRASIGGAWHPGKVVGSNCNVGYGGGESVNPTYQILVMTATDTSFYPQNWVAPSVVTGVGFVGGSVNGTNMRVCRGPHNNAIHPGKEWGSNCNIGWGGKEIALTSYTVLSLPNGHSYNAAITEQRNSVDPETDKIVTNITLTTLVDYPASYSFATPSLTTPAGFTVTAQSVDNGLCTNTPGSTCRQHFRWTLNPGTNCRLNGSYTAKLVRACAGGANTCGTGPQEIGFSLESENFCTVVNADTSRAWGQINGLFANDVAIGGETLQWFVGTSATAGGYGMFRLDMNKTAGMNISGGAVRISVGPDGNPWCVNDSGKIFRMINNGWSAFEGNAKDIGVGGGGSGIAWAIGANPAAGGYSIHRQEGNGWAQVSGGAIRIDVDPQGRAWVVNDGGNVYRYNGSGWDNVTGGKPARDVGVGENGAVFIAGTDGNAYKWNGTGWTDRGRQGTGFVSIAVGSSGIPVAIDSSNQIWVGQP